MNRHQIGIAIVSICLITCYVVCQSQINALKRDLARVDKLLINVDKEVSAFTGFQAGVIAITNMNVETWKRVE